MIDAIPPEILAEQLQITAHIDAITARRLVKFWRRLDPAKMTREAMIAFMIDVVRQIVMAYGEVAALAAVDFYDMVREVGGWSGKAAVASSAVPPQEQLKRIVRWGIGPLWEETPRPEAALGRLQGATSRLALQPGRRTTYEMIKRDRVRWARVPQGKTCAFCLMLCSRGAVYTSEASAGQPDALKFHSACDCIIVPVGPGQALPAINQELQEEWREATRGQRDQIGAWNEYVAAKYPGAGLMSRTALKTTAKTRAAHH
ncbi:MAG: hypothetical protein GX113_10965 [Actinobacteria bacterium]|jgi:hypothetical protein|nr:hypothetical protein [Actinomycetota bacterium]